MTHPDEGKGRIKEAAGTLTGDKGLKREGKADQASGKLKQGVENAREKVTNAVNPKGHR